MSYHFTSALADHRIRELHDQARRARFNRKARHSASSTNGLASVTHLRSPRPRLEATQHPADAA